jgi:hypothetical protein
VKKAKTDIESASAKKHVFAAGFVQYALGKKIMSHAEQVVDRNAKDLLADATFNDAEEAVKCLVANIPCTTSVHQTAVTMQVSLVTISAKILDAVRSWSAARFSSQEVSSCESCLGHGRELKNYANFVGASASVCMTPLHVIINLDCCDPPSGGSHPTESLSHNLALH